jgi:hypothetical protein
MRKKVKIMRYIIFILMIFLVFFDSCTTKFVDKTNVCYLEEQSDLIVASDIVNSVTLLPLETNDDFITGSINKILNIDNLYYFLDKKTKTVFIYDETGKSMNKIFHAGNGPGEYISIDDFIVTDHHIILLCVPSKLMFYNKESLKVEHEFKITNNTFYSKMVEWKGNILLCDYTTGKVDCYHYEKISNIFNWNVLKGYIPSSTPAFYICGDKLYFHASGDDVIYSVGTDLTFSPYLTFDYDKKQRAIDFYSTREIEPLKNLRDIVEYPLVDVENIFQNRNGVGFFYIFAGLSRVSFINNDNTRVYKLSSIPVNAVNFSDNVLISWMFPYTINSELERFKGIDLKNYSDTLQEHDNPLLLVYELKN